MQLPANHNIERLFEQPVRATGTGGLGPRILAKDDSFLPRHQSSLGSGCEAAGPPEGRGASSAASSRGVPVKTSKPDISSAQRELHDGEASNPGRIQSLIFIMTGGGANKSPGIENAWRNMEKVPNQTNLHLFFAKISLRLFYKIKPLSLRLGGSALLLRRAHM
jgi:hypothetical protein